MTNIIELPELEGDLPNKLLEAYLTGGLLGEKLEAVITAYLAEVVRWQDIEADKIRPGMRVRETLEGRYRKLQTTFVVTRVGDHHIYAGDSIYPKASSHFWQVDPRTLPADSDQAILDLLTEWIGVDADTGLSRLREVADVTPKAVAGDEWISKGDRNEQQPQ